MFRKSTYFNKITTDLTVLARTVETKNKLSLTDDTKWSEDFFKELLNRIFGYQLVNLNTVETNYAGIDLGDSTNRVCIQVTATNDSTKIKDTLSISDKHKRYNDYSNLIILIVGYKKKYTGTFSSKFSNFDKDKSIIDIRTLLSEIRKLSPDDMKVISDFIDSELTGVIAINPIDLLDDDISVIIDVLNDYVNDGKNNISHNPQQQYKLTKRDDGFISLKNELNNVDDILFNSEIRPSLQYDRMIEKFLGNPINAEYQKKYFIVTEMIQSMYSENKAQFMNIGELFGYIFDEVINYKNRKHIDDDKLLILLHNMYFNCDIGNNPT